MLSRWRYHNAKNDYSDRHSGHEHEYDPLYGTARDQSALESTDIYGNSGGPCRDAYSHGIFRDLWTPLRRPSLPVQQNCRHCLMILFPWDLCVSHHYSRAEYRMERLQWHTCRRVLPEWRNISFRNRTPWTGRDRKEYGKGFKDETALLATDWVPCCCPYRDDLRHAQSITALRTKRMPKIGWKWKNSSIEPVLPWVPFLSFLHSSC